MGKATGISSQFRGKVGNVIGYLTKNRAGRYEQTVKAYQPVVANPQSYAQALARVPVGPVQRVCSALLPVIQRGFEGVAYGDASKNEFLSYNLRYFRGPFMEKGSVLVPPGEMLISKGSLRPIDIAGFDDEEFSEMIRIGLAMRNDYYPTTYGELSAHLLDRNHWLVPGEQLTFVLVVQDTHTYYWHYQSFFLDATSTKLLDGFFNNVSAVNSRMAISWDDARLEGFIVAGAVIRSQPYGDTSFKRSTAFLTCNPLANVYNDEAAVRAAVASYRTGEDPEDWEDDPTPEYQQLAYLCMVNITSDMVLSPTTPSITGKQCLGYVTKGGEMGIFYLYSTTYGSNVLLDGQAAILLGQGPSGQIPYSYNGSYQPAREYSNIYGHM